MVSKPQVSYIHVSYVSRENYLRQNVFFTISGRRTKFKLLWKNRSIMLKSCYSR